MTMTLDPHTPTKKHHQGSNKPLDVVEWVNELTTLMTPDQVVWCDGSKEEATSLIELMVAQGTLEALNPDLRPNSYLARSSPSDVARVECRTFI